LRRREGHRTHALHRRRSGRGHKISRRRGADRQHEAVRAAAAQHHHAARLRPLDPAGAAGTGECGDAGVLARIAEVIGRDAGAKGIEPSYAAWEAAVLPLTPAWCASAVFDWPRHAWRAPSEPESHETW